MKHVFTIILFIVSLFLAVSLLISCGIDWLDKRKEEGRVFPWKKCVLGVLAAGVAVTGYLGASRLVNLALGLEPPELGAREVSQISIYHYYAPSPGSEGYTIDFEANQLIHAKYYGADMPRILHTKDLDLKKREVFIEACNENYLLGWEEYYKDPSTKDGDQWSISIQFADGSSEHFYGCNAYPMTWKEMGTAFCGFTGENGFWIRELWKEDHCEYDDQLS